MPTYSHTCDHCNEEIIATGAVPPTSAQCAGCGKLWTGLGKKDWDVEMEVEEPEYDDATDRYKTTKELWGDNVTRVFNVAMRLDGARVGPSLIGSVVQSRATVGKHGKSTTGAKVLTVKGGRKGGGSVMGASAAAASGRGGAGGRQGEEWLHLWGDNLGGPSSSANFVAGSYAANTEMLAIEHALAVNILCTAGLPISVTATCSSAHVGEYVTYELMSPTGSGNFTHAIDLDNRYFTKAEYVALEGAVVAWLKTHSLFDTSK